MSQNPSAPQMQMPAHQNAQPIGFITQQPQPQAQPTTFQAPYYSPYPTPYPPNNPVMSSQITQPATQIILPPQLTNNPVTCLCPMCKQTVTTKVTYKSGTRTHLSAAVLCALDQDCCALIPYCCNCTKDAHHYCPHKNCGYYFGKHEPSL